MQIETELLPCKLDPVERKEKGEELSRMILKHKRLEEEKKAAAKEWKERLDDHAEKILALSHEVKTGKADRLVEIEERAGSSRSRSAPPPRRAASTSSGWTPARSFAPAL